MVVQRRLKVDQPDYNLFVLWYRLNLEKYGLVRIVMKYGLKII